MMLRTASQAAVHFPQEDFLSLVRSTPSSHGTLRVKAQDEGTLLQLMYSEKDPSPETPAECIYQKLDSLPTEEQELQTLVEQLRSRLPAQFNVVVLVPNTDASGFAVQCYVSSSSSDKAQSVEVFQHRSIRDLYSRSILEPDCLSHASVCIVGVGSGGSHVALELAKSGVGRFVLIDNDRLEYCNIIRHVCGANDVGRYKTKAIKERLQDRNIHVKVQTLEEDISIYRTSEEIQKAVSSCQVIVAATDTTASRYNINSLAWEKGKVAIFGKCTARAAGGDVLVFRPGQTACYACIHGTTDDSPTDQEQTSVESVRETTPGYVPDSSVEASIQVGLSSDIIPIANLIVKLVLVELCRDKYSDLSSLQEDLTANYYRWANRREGAFANYPAHGIDKFNEPSILRWYTKTFSADSSCPVCLVNEMEPGEVDDAFFGKPSVD